MKCAEFRIVSAGMLVTRFCWSQFEVWRLQDYRGRTSQFTAPKDVISVLFCAEHWVLHHPSAFNFYEKHMFSAM